MKKLVIGFIAALMLMIPVTAFAVSYGSGQEAKLSFGVICSHVVGDDGKSYPSYCNVDVYKYVDGNNACYVVVGGSHSDVPGISCIKR